MHETITFLAARDLLEDATRIATLYRVTVEEMMGRDRHRPMAYARHHFWAELYSRGHWSYLAIGKLCGVDHSTVIHGITAHHHHHRPAKEAYVPT